MNRKLYSWCIKDASYSVPELGPRPCGILSAALSSVTAFSFPNSESSYIKIFHKSIQEIFKKFRYPSNHIFSSVKPFVIHWNYAVKVFNICFQVYRDENSSVVRPKIFSRHPGTSIGYIGGCQT